MKARYIFVDISGGYMVGSVLRTLDVAGATLFKCSNNLVVDAERLTLYTKLAERVICAHLTDMTRFY